MAPRLRIEAYDPDAVDADNDGIVQEGTAFERPAGTQIVDELGNIIQAGITATSRGNFRVVNRDGSAVKYTPTYGKEKPSSRLGASLGQRQQSLGDRLPSLGATIGTLADRGTNVAGERKPPPKVADPTPSVPDLPDVIDDIEDLDEIAATADQIIERYGVVVPSSKIETSDGGMLGRLPDGRYVAIREDGKDRSSVSVFEDFYRVAWDLDTTAEEAEIFADQWRELKRSRAYHGTPAENLADIRRDGLDTMNRTRGIGNRDVGNSVFVTTNWDTAASYGDEGAVIEIDVARMVEDGLLGPDDVSREPGWDRADVLQSVASELEDYDFDPYSEFSGTGLDAETFILSQRIPPEYLTIDGEPISGRTPNRPTADTKFYHGSSEKLEVGDYILPPDETGRTPRSHPDIDPLEFDNDRYVYLTDDSESAADYAADAGSGTRYVYEVEPLDPDELEVDPEFEMGLADDPGSVRVMRPVKIVGRTEIGSDGQPVSESSRTPDDETSATLDRSGQPLNISVPGSPEFYGVTRIDDRGYGNPKYDELRALGEDKNQTIRGVPIDPDDPSIPDTLYHVSTDVASVRRDGTLRARGAGGLGGDSRDSIVSLTVNSETADQLESDMRLMAQISRNLDNPDEYIRLVKDDMNKYGTEMTERQETKLRAALESDPSGAYRLYFVMRSMVGSEPPDPMFFDNATERFADMNPDSIGIVQVPKQNLQTGAMVTNFDLGQDSLDEIRIYGDVNIAE